MTPPPTPTPTGPGAQERDASGLKQWPIAEEIERLKAEIETRSELIADLHAENRRLRDERDRVREDNADLVESVRSVVSECDHLRALLRSARSYIPRSGLVDHADLLADIARVLGETP